ncbi:MAG: type IV pilus modification PilV family protein [Candidatus Rokuibacteriota bacterium]
MMGGLGGPPKPPDARSAGRDPGGFSLLEVLIALAILGTAVVAAIQGVSQGLRLLKVSGDQQQATVVADQKAREVISPVEGVDAGSEGRFSWQRVTRVVETPELTPADSSPKWRVFEITVAVTWDEQRRVDVTTLRTMPATSDPTRDTTGSSAATQAGAPSPSPAGSPGSTGSGAGSSGGGIGSGSGSRLPSLGGVRR